MENGHFKLTGFLLKTTATLILRGKKTRRRRDKRKLFITDHSSCLATNLYEWRPAERGRHSEKQPRSGSSGTTKST